MAMRNIRSYGDYEELSKHILETYWSVYEADVYSANEALKRAVEKAATMWDEASEMQRYVTELRDLQELYLDPWVEKERAWLPRDTDYVATTMLDTACRKFREALLKDVSTNEAFLVDDKHTKISSSCPPLFLDMHNPRT
jgi:hypothetical protein